MNTKYSLSVESISCCDGTMTVIVKKSHELDAVQVALLRKFKNKGWLEFRNYRHEDKQEEKEVELCYKLAEMELVESDGMSWHTTFHLTDIGKKVVSQII